MAIVEGQEKGMRKGGNRSRN